MFVEDVLGQIAGNVGLLLSVGFMVGMMHAFEPDHVAAMLAHMQDKRRRARAHAKPRLEAIRRSLPGALWGFGHTSMILLVSLLVLVFALSIPAAVFDGFELMVGVMLIVLGAAIYWRRAFGMEHSHPHAHENGITHTHPHRHDGGHSHNHRSYLIGCLHGLAGSGVLIATSAVALGDASWVLGFVLVFGIGSMIGMMIISGTLSAALLSGRFAKLRRFLQVLTGGVTIAIGAKIIYELAASWNVSVFLQ